MFVDEARFYVAAGSGGDGMVAFRREKYVPRGGPAGGDGGKGGDVIFVASTEVNTLAEFRHKRHWRADAGGHGGPKQMTGKNGKDLYIRVPLGTLIFDADTDEQLADLTKEGSEFIAAKGGRGGLGNQHFATSRNKAPRKATPGKPGEEITIRLELKLLADVGLVGYPSVGKSTLIAAISNARPKIAAYPFTTLAPNLGVVQWRAQREFVIADIPGLIEGAHEGHGLGLQFLKHIERTNLLVHVLEVTKKLEDHDDDREPIKDFEVLRQELKRFNPELVERPQMVVLNKCDLPYVQEEADRLREHFEGMGLKFMTISAASRENLGEFIEALGQRVLNQRVDDDREGGLEWWEREDALPPKAEEE